MITLITKDPHQRGNAILYGVVRCPHTDEELALVETDFGNKMRLMSSELHEMYSMGSPRDYSSWRHDRMMLQQEEPNG